MEIITYGINQYKHVSQEDKVTNKKKRKRRELTKSVTDAASYKANTNHKGAHAEKESVRNIEQINKKEKKKGNEKKKNELKFIFEIPRKADIT